MMLRAVLAVLALFIILLAVRVLLSRRRSTRPR
jgi:hypothetical protein